MTDLPKGWGWATIGEITTDVSKTDPRSEPDQSFRYIDIGAIDGATGTITESQLLRGSEAPSRARQVVRAGDTILSTVRTYMRKTALLTAELDGAVASTGFAVLRPLPGIRPDYLFHAVRRDEFVGALSALQTGSSYPAVRDKDVRSMPIPVAPPDEQHRIVAAIEEHLSGIESAEASLCSAQQRLEQLAVKARDFVLTDAPRRPLGELAVDVRYGTSVKCSYEAEGPAVLRIPNIVNERVDVTDLKFATDATSVSEGTVLAPGDVLFVRTNGSRDLIGRAAVVTEEAACLSFASYLIRYRLADGVDPAYVSAVVSATESRRQLEAMAATTAGQYNLSIGKLNTLMVPMPTLEEQSRLVRRRNEVLEVMARLQPEIDRAAARSSALRRAILVAAFSGQLVPQDPNDDPAAVLLERVRAERAAASPARRSRKAKAT